MYSKNIEEIEGLITIYFEGIFYGDIAKLTTCFHENVYMYGDIKDVDYLKSVKEYLEGVENRQSPNDLNETFKMKIIGIEILGKIAIAKLHVPMLGYNYYDYLSLVKINNDWKIVNKLFSHIE
ncbi:nuclear transport factor 2 family protein [Pedobacter sp. SYSU D00535]|uniref:nuclear transport factor 2 family protein n=1 Tax=Pedobacter sp. SYSU D00535 TaxID=2810308 RepID=UPI001A9614DB|nr:nuclear transport factor 2 family protein [Pedobacter sp. SYSU D00535]